MSSSATGVGMPICFLGAILLILTQKSSQKFGDVLGIFYSNSIIRRTCWSKWTLLTIGIRNKARCIKNNFHSVQFIIEHHLSTATFLLV